MSTSLIDADSMLVVDVGAIHTRAMLFDVVDGRYRYLASGVAPSTAGAPFHDVGEGVNRAIGQLQKITARILVGPDERLIIPARNDGTGVDTFAATLSAGAPVKMVVVGLLEDVSLQSARRMAASMYGRVLETISLNDRRKTEARIDTILKLRPDLVLVAGGTEGGASQSVLRLLEPVGLACYLLPESLRPAVLFAGNQDLQTEVRSSLEKITELHFAPNVRPSLDFEQIDAAQVHLSNIFSHIRTRQIPGVRELIDWSGGGLMPTAAAFGRLIRFLDGKYKSAKGRLGIDLGASAATVAATFDGELVLGVYPQFGLGQGLADLLDHVALEDIARWLSVDLPPDYLRDYIYNKAIYPASIPVTQEDLAVEQALARTLLRGAISAAAAGFPKKALSPGGGLLPWMEPIIASGSVLTRAPSLGNAMMTLLDGLQPTGVTTIVLDQHHLAAALGAAARFNPILTVQVMDSSTFLHLGTVIAPVGSARPGTPVLRVKLTYESGHETSLDVKQGALEVLPLPTGQSARLQVQPLHRFDMGMGAPGRGGKLNVHGGALGVIIDARGRPLQLPDDPARRQELFKKWIWTLGG